MFEVFVEVFVVLTGVGFAVSLGVLGTCLVWTKGHA
jgi:hypothetical protein